MLKNWIDKINEYSSLLLILVTTVYVVLTFFLLKQSKIQNENNIENNKILVSPQLLFEISPSTQENYLGVMSGPDSIKLLSATINFSITNVGQTIGIPIYMNSVVDSINNINGNMRDSIFQIIDDRKLFKTFFIHTNNQSLEFGALIPKIPYTFYYSITDKYADKNGKFYLHLYILYSDIFRQLKDIYCVYPFEIYNGNIAFHDPITLPYKFSKKDTEKFFKYYLNGIPQHR